MHWPLYVTLSDVQVANIDHPISIHNVDSVMSVKSYFQTTGVIISVTVDLYIVEYRIRPDHKTILPFCLCIPIESHLLPNSPRPILFLCRRGDTNVTTTSNDPHGISNYRSTRWFCSDQQQRNIKGPRYCAFAREIRRWPVDSPHEGTIMFKGYLHGLVQYCCFFILQSCTKPSISFYQLWYSTI